MVHTAGDNADVNRLVAAPPGPDRSGYAQLAAAIGSGRYTLLSTDLFDTVLLRDHTTETQRLARACRRAAPLLGVDAEALTRLRWSFHDAAYRAVAMERPDGDASLSAVCTTIAMALGLDSGAGRLLARTEVDVDITHLRPNHRLLAVFEQASRHGMRVVAVSDTYYSTSDLRHIITEVVGPHPLTAVHSSADHGLTKHGGRLFDRVAEQEVVPADRILHVGDHPIADVRRAREAGWTAVHLPRGTRFRAARFAGRVASLPARMRRDR